MANRTFGEQLYLEYVHSGERRRFAYEDVQVLKKVQSAEELRLLCSRISGESILASASAREMLETCVARDPDQSDAEAVGNVFSTDIEGCLLGIIAIPVMLIGVLLGAVLRTIGLTLDFSSRRCVLVLITGSVFSIVLGVGTSFLLQIEWPLWFGTFSGLCCGIVIPQLPPRSVKGAVFLAAFIPITVLIGTFQTLSYFDPLPMIGSALGIGVGYGLTNSPGTLFAKRRGAKIRNGLIILRKF